MITHYHADHVGGVTQLAAKLPVKHYVDYGPNRNRGESGWAVLRVPEGLGSGQHITVKPGDKIPVKGLDVQVLTADGERIQTPLKGAGQPTRYAARTSRVRRQDENARSTEP